MLRDFGYIGIFLVFAIFVPVGMLLLSWAFTFVRVRPKKPNPVKSTTYECGMQPIGGSWIQFNFRYYFYALLFVVFEIETVFLYPWAVYFKQLKLFGLIEMAVFILILLVAYLYAWKKKAMEWS